MKACEELPAFPEGDEADALAGYTGDLVELYTGCAMRHDSLIFHIKTTNKSP